MSHRHRPVSDRASDPELAAAVQAGDPAAFDLLATRHRAIVRSPGRRYFLIGGDRDDVEQEALIGLYKAARDFQPDRQVAFRTFAELCINRQVVTAIKTANRKKHQPLNRSTSITPPTVDGEEGREVTVADPDADPLAQLVRAEATAATQQTIGEVLSPLEADVLRRFVAGASYETIAAEVGRHTKAVDNALQRVKRKLAPELAARLVA